MKTNIPTTLTHTSFVSGNLNKFSRTFGITIRIIPRTNRYTENTKRLRALLLMAFLPFSRLLTAPRLAKQLPGSRHLSNHLLGQFSHFYQPANARPLPACGKGFPRANRRSSPSGGVARRQLPALMRLKFWRSMHGSLALRCADRSLMKLIRDEESFIIISWKINNFYKSTLGSCFAGWDLL